MVQVVFCMWAACKTAARETTLHRDRRLAILTLLPLASESGPEVEVLG